MSISHLIRVENVTPIEANDSSLFREVFRSDGIYHANSWLYMLRATRGDEGNLGYKYWGKGVLIGVGYRKQTIYLIHPIGKKRRDVVLSLCEQIAHLGITNIVLRRLDRDLYSALLDTGKFKGVDNPVVLEDDAYPETMVIVDRLLADNRQSSPTARKLRKQARKFERRHYSLSARTNFSETDLQSILSATHRMADNIHDKYTSYVQMLGEVIRNGGNSSLYSLNVFHKDNEIHGIYLVEFLSPDQVGLYCALTSKAFPGITEWIDYSFFEAMYERGVRIVYLGGSETQGVYEYINKLLPSFPPYRMHSLLYRSNMT